MRAGEIVGLAGVDANGQSELIEAIIGLRPRDAGHGPRRRARHHRRRRRASALDAGVGHIAEDRHRRGLVLEFDLAENLALRDYRTPAIAGCGLLSPARMVDARAARCSQEFDVRGGDAEHARRARCRAATSRRS